MFAATQFLKSTYHAIIELSSFIRPRFRLDLLSQKNQAVALSTLDLADLDEFELLENSSRTLKAHLRRKNGS